MLRLVNRDRANSRYRDETHGQARPLQWNPQLADMARCHSIDMVRHHYFDHTTPSGVTVEQRLAAAGIGWHHMGENLAYANSVRGAERMFMSEPPFQQNHRANILNPLFTEVGIGVAKAPNGQVWVTQDFIGQ